MTSSFHRNTKQQENKSWALLAKASLALDKPLSRHPALRAINKSRVVSPAPLSPDGESGFAGR